MPLGDVGGTNPTCIITCIAISSIKKGDPVTFHGDYQVSNDLYGHLFGKALKDAKYGEALPVAVKGVVSFDYEEGFIDIEYVKVEDGELKQSNAQGVLVLYQDDERVDVLL